MDNNQQVKEAMEKDQLLFGTVDSWLIWNMTGGTKVSIFIIY